MKLLSTRLAICLVATALALTACGGGGSSSSSSSSSASATTATGAVVAPLGPVAMAGNAQANVTFSAPTSAGGGIVTGYTVTSTPLGGFDNNAGSTALNHLVTGLTNGVSYTFTVTAAMADGATGASKASNAVMPGLPAQWSVTGSLQADRERHTATLLPNGKVLVVGGIYLQGLGLSNYLATFVRSEAELYDSATKLWASAAPLATARYDHTATLLPNGKVLVTGGYDLANHASASVELYDPATNTWTAGPPMTTARDKHAATLLPNGKVLITGGYDIASEPIAKVELYDPASNTWSAGGSMADARSLHTASLLPNGKVIVLGGTGINYAAPSVELYNPETNTWAAAARAAVCGGVRITATLLPNGKLLCVQGFRELSATPDRLNGELYDPIADKWAPAGALSTSHVGGHTATLLANGTLLVVGGGYESVHSAATYATDVTEVYNPIANTWSISAPLLKDPRQGHTATLLPNGALLVVGGAATNGAYYESTRASALLYQ